MDRRIALVSLPFASSRRPSLQIGLLAGLAREAGWQADPLHVNLDFARMLGRARYEALCQHRGTMLSEWVFAGAAFSGQDHTIEGTLTGFDIDPSTSALGMPADDALAWLHRVRSVLAPAFLRAVSEGIDWSAYDVVGFTSTFQQNVASLALARAIKEEHPRVTTLFGGANFDSVMGLEYLRVFPYVDYAAIGEADTSLPSFLRDFTGPDTVVHTPGMAHRDPETGEVLLEPLDTPFDDLDALPTPDYDDYFDRATRLGFFDHDSPARIDLPYESARGCLRHPSSAGAPLRHVGAGLRDHARLRRGQGALRGSPRDGTAA